MSTTTWKHKNLLFLQKFEIEFRLVFCLTCFLFNSKLNFVVYLDLCQKDEIQVGLNKHLYDDIGDASLSLRGLTSSRFLFCWAAFLFISLLASLSLSFSFSSVLAWFMRELGLWTDCLAFMDGANEIDSRPAAWSYIPVQSYSCSLRVFYMSMTLVVGKDSY